MSAVRDGCLLLADISGYTSYLSGVELEHSHDVLADLLGAELVGEAPHEAAGHAPAPGL